MTLTTPRTPEPWSVADARTAAASFTALSGADQQALHDELLTLIASVERKRRGAQVCRILLINAQPGRVCVVLQGPEVAAFMGPALFGLLLYRRMDATPGRSLLRRKSARDRPDLLDVDGQHVHLRDLVEQAAGRL